MILGCWLIHSVVVEEWELVEHLGFWTWAVSPFAVGGLNGARLHEVWTFVALQSMILAGLGFGLWLRFRRLQEGKS